MLLRMAYICVFDRGKQTNALGRLSLNLENFLPDSILEFRSLTFTTHRINFEYQELDLSSKVHWGL